MCTLPSYDIVLRSNSKLHVHMRVFGSESNVWRTVRTHSNRINRIKFSDFLAHVYIECIAYSKKISLSHKRFARINFVHIVWLFALSMSMNFLHHPGTSTMYGHSFCVEYNRIGVYGMVWKGMPCSKMCKIERIQKMMSRKR